MKSKKEIFDFIRPFLSKPENWEDYEFRSRDIQYNQVKLEKGYYVVFNFDPNNTIPTYRLQIYLNGWRKDISRLFPIETVYFNIFSKQYWVLRKYDKEMRQWAQREIENKKKAKLEKLFS